MPCVIWGEPETDQAHIFPRALHAMEGSAFSEGTKFQAKGLYDPDLLCRLHEDAFREADDYGIRFIRQFLKKGRATFRDKVWEVPNPKPRLLVRFVAACIWMPGVSPVGAEGADLDLGLAEPRLRDLLFNPTTSFNLPLVLKRCTFASQGQVLHPVSGCRRKGLVRHPGAGPFCLRLRVRDENQSVQLPPIVAPFLANDACWAAGAAHSKESGVAERLAEGLAVLGP